MHFISYDHDNALSMYSVWTSTPFTVGDRVTGALCDPYTHQHGATKDSLRQLLNILIAVIPFCDFQIKSTIDTQECLRKNVSNLCCMLYDTVRT